MFRLQSTVNHGEKLLPGQRIVAKAAQHAARNEIRVRLMHAARAHAMMRRLDDDVDPLRIEGLLDRVGNLCSHLLLNLQPFSIDFDDPGELTDADYPTARDVRSPGPTNDRREVMFGCCIARLIQRKSNFFGEAPLGAKPPGTNQ
jgi:hypothetical protein